MNFLRFAVMAAMSLSLCVLPAQAAETLRISSTIGPVDAGMLPLLADTFSKKTGIEITMEKAGTGKTLKKAEGGTFDLVMVHARKLEDAFCAAGFGIDRRDVMYNDFVILGPKADPAKIAGKTTAEALKAIYDAKAVFVSRGDKSGTHNAEKKLWKANGLTPDQEEFYISAGQGMMTTINIAAEKGGYTLTDRATWIKFAAKQGDAAGQAVVDKYVSYLACGLVNVINIFQPDMVCVGGGVCRQGENLLGPVRAIIEQDRYSKYCQKQTELCVAQLGNDAGIIGAAMLHRAVR